MSQIFFAKKNVVWWTLFCTRMRWINNLAKFICVLKSKIIFSWNRYVYLVDCVIWRFFFSKSSSNRRPNCFTASYTRTTFVLTNRDISQMIEQDFFREFFCTKVCCLVNLFCTRMRWINNLAEFICELSIAVQRTKYYKTIRNFYTKIVFRRKSKTKF